MVMLKDIRAVVFAALVLSVPSQAETNVQQRHIRGRTKIATRELQLGLNPFETSPAQNSLGDGSDETSERQGLRTGQWLKTRTRRDNSASNFKNFNRIIKGRNIFRIQPDETRQQQSPSVPVEASSPSTKPSKSDSNLEENSISGRVAGNGKNDNETTSRDRIGTPSRENTNFSEESDKREADAGIASRDGAASHRDDQKIGGPTRDWKRDNFESNEDTSIDREDAAENEVTGDFINHKTREEKKLGEPTRLTNRDDFLSNEETAMFARGTVSTNKTSDSESDEAGRDANRIGVASTDRDNRISYIEDSAFLGVRGAF